LQCALAKPFGFGPRHSSWPSSPEDARSQRARQDIIISSAPANVSRETIGAGIDTDIRLLMAAILRAIIGVCGRSQAPDVRQNVSRETFFIAGNGAAPDE